MVAFLNIDTKQKILFLLYPMKSIVILFVSVIVIITYCYTKKEQHSNISSQNEFL